LQIPNKSSPAETGRVAGADVKANEFSKRAFLSTKYALGVSMATEEGQTIESEMRLAKEAILQFARDRGRSASDILITVVGDDDEMAALETFMANVAKNEPDLAPVFAKIPTRVNIYGLPSETKKTLIVSG
jgi:hypothetical protein